MCKLFYTLNNKQYILLNVIISKHNQSSSNLNNLKINDFIYVKIIGFKFSKNSTYINSICDIISTKEITQIKKYNIIINNLHNIDLSFKTRIVYQLSYCFEYYD